MNCLRSCLVLAMACGCEAPAVGGVIDATVCDVLANPPSFDGQVIRLKGATIAAGFDTFVIDGSACNPPAAMWLAYPNGTQGKAGPAALLRVRLASTSAVGEDPGRAAVTLQRDDGFALLESFLATPYRPASGICLGCRRYNVTATVVGRLDGVRTAGVLRDATGRAIGVEGFGNANLYRARLVLRISRTEH
jgi:hypothetical protein